MADLIVETGVGLTTSNSYIDQDGADAYHEMRLHNTDWTGASGSVKEAALMWASSLLDTLVYWNGSKASSTQSMRWPRVGVYDTDGYLIESSEIPQFLKDAVSEYAMILIADDVTAVNDLAGYKKLKVDVIEIEFDKWDRNSNVPGIVWDLVKPYGSKSTSKQRSLERM